MRTWIEPLQLFSLIAQQLTGREVRRLHPCSGSSYFPMANGYHYTPVQPLTHSDLDILYHLHHLREDLGGICQSGLTVNRSLFHLGMIEAHYLGYRISHCPLKLQKKKVEAIRQYPYQLACNRLMYFGAVWLILAFLCLISLSFFHFNEKG